MEVVLTARKIDGAWHWWPMKKSQPDETRNPRFVSTTKWGYLAQPGRIIRKKRKILFYDFDIVKVRKTLQTFN